MNRKNRRGSRDDTPAIETMPVGALPLGLPDLRLPVDSAKAELLRAQIATVARELAVARPEGTAKLTRAATKLLGRLGGLRKALAAELNKLEAARSHELARLAGELLPGMLAADVEFQAALPLAVEFLRAEVADLAKHVGGGELNNGPASFVASAALQLAASRVLFARGEFKVASGLANDSATNLARAHEYAARRAESRGREGAGVPLMLPSISINYSKLAAIPDAEWAAIEAAALANDAGMVEMRATAAVTPAPRPASSTPAPSSEPEPPGRSRRHTPRAEPATPPPARSARPHPVDPQDTALPNECGSVVISLFPNTFPRRDS